LFVRSLLDVSTRVQALATVREPMWSPEAEQVV
jgi:hypothetical protein